MGTICRAFRVKKALKLYCFDASLRYGILVSNGKKLQIA